MRIYKLHLYEQLTCDFPHTSFADDIRKLFESHRSREEVSFFVNSHGNEYLTNLMEAHTPLLREYLTDNHLVRRGKSSYIGAINRYFGTLTARRQQRQQLAQVSPGTETEQ